MRFISERDSRFTGLKILLPLEFSVKQYVFKDPYEINSEEITEALFLFRYYAVPKTNLNINIMTKLARLIKFSVAKVDLTKIQESAQAIAMTVSMILASEEELVDTTYVNIIFKLLLEALQVPIKVAREASRTFGNLLHDKTIEVEQDQKQE